MLLRVLPCGLLLLASTAAAFQEAGEPFKSGPQKGATLGAAFHPFNLNGDLGKDRYHCLVCEYGLSPVVMIFATERADAKDKALDELLVGVEKALARDLEGYLKGFVVFVSKDFRSSVTAKVAEPKELDTKALAATAKDLVEEATDRAALLARLRERIDRLKLKHLVVSCHPAAGLESYHAAKADVTVVLYVKQKVVANFAYPEGKLTEKDVSEILRSVDDLAGRARKKPPAKRENPKAASGGTNGKGTGSLESQVPSPFRSCRSGGLRLQDQGLGRQGVPERPAAVLVKQWPASIRVEPLAQHAHLDRVADLVLLQQGEQVLR
jgi:hypothetical protein